MSHMSACDWMRWQCTMAKPWVLIGLLRPMGGGREKIREEREAERGY